MISGGIDPLETGWVRYPDAEISGGTGAPPSPGSPSAASGDNSLSDIFFRTPLAEVPGAIFRRLNLWQPPRLAIGLSHVMTDGNRMMGNRISHYLAMAERARKFPGGLLGIIKSGRVSASTVARPPSEQQDSVTPLDFLRARTNLVTKNDESPENLHRLYYMYLGIVIDKLSEKLNYDDSDRQTLAALFIILETLRAEDRGIIIALHQTIDLAHLHMVRERIAATLGVSPAHWDALLDGMRDDPLRKTRIRFDGALTPRSQLFGDHPLLDISVLTDKRYHHDALYAQGPSQTKVMTRDGSTFIHEIDRTGDGKTAVRVESHSPATIAQLVQRLASKNNGPLEPLQVYPESNAVAFIRRAAIDSLFNLTHSESAPSHTIRFATSASVTVSFDRASMRYQATYHPLNDGSLGEWEEVVRESTKGDGHVEAKVTREFTVKSLTTASGIASALFHAALTANPKSAKELVLPRLKSTMSNFGILGTVNSAEAGVTLNQDGKVTCLVVTLWSEQNHGVKLYGRLGNGGIEWTAQSYGPDSSHPLLKVAALTFLEAIFKGKQVISSWQHASTPWNVYLLDPFHRHPREMSETVAHNLPLGLNLLSAPGEAIISSHGLSMIWQEDTLPDSTLALIFTRLPEQIKAVNTWARDLCLRYQSSEIRRRLNDIVLDLAILNGGLRYADNLRGNPEEALTADSHYKEIRRKLGGIVRDLLRLDNSDEIEDLSALHGLSAEIGMLRSKKMKKKNGPSLEREQLNQLQHFIDAATDSPLSHDELHGLLLTALLLAPPDISGKLPGSTHARDDRFSRELSSVESGFDGTAIALSKSARTFPGINRAHEIFKEEMEKKGLTSDTTDFGRYLRLIGIEMDIHDGGLKAESIAWSRHITGKLRLPEEERSLAIKILDAIAPHVAGEPPKSGGAPVSGSSIIVAGTTQGPQFGLLQPGTTPISSGTQMPQMGAITVIGADHFALVQGTQARTLQAPIAPRAPAIPPIARPPAILGR